MQEEMGLRFPLFPHIEHALEGNLLQGQRPL